MAAPKNHNLKLAGRRKLEPVLRNQLSNGWRLAGWLKWDPGA